MATAAPRRPKLRHVEPIFIQDRTRGRMLMLRDTEGIAPGGIMVPAPLAAILARFDGTRTVAQIAAEVSRASGSAVDEAFVAQLADDLDAAYMLDTPRYRERRREVVRDFTSAAVRPAFHAGGAYHGDAEALTAYIEEECLGKATRSTRRGAMLGLCAPHMDLWRAAVGYGHAYRALHDALPSEVDTFVLLGTSHAPMRQPFAICDKTFATPLGALPPDHEAIRALADAATFDVREDEYRHKTEHSLEFQAVFLRHALGEREARIVPILCGLGESQSTGRDPSLEADAESFIRGLRRLIDGRPGRVMLIAGADLAHIGPRFGDRRPLDERGRERLANRDADSIDLALDRDASGFFQHVFEDLETRRVCGLGPIYTMLRALPEASGELLHYEQCVDPDEGSIVSHASLGFYG